MDGAVFGAKRSAVELGTDPVHPFARPSKFTGIFVAKSGHSSVVSIQRGLLTTVVKGIWSA